MSADPAIQDTLLYPAHYSKEATRKTLSVIAAANRLFDTALTTVQVPAILKDIKKDYFKLDTISAGLMQVISIFIRVDDYLKAELFLYCIDDRVISKVYKLTPENKVWTSVKHMYGQDFKYARETYVPIMSFPITTIYLPEYIYAAQVSSANLSRAALAHPDYRFNLPPVAARRTDPLFCQYTDHKMTYSLKKLIPGYDSLVLAKDTTALTTLLYSPNYVFAIEAMEALIYLSKKTGITLSSATLQKIETVRSASYPFKAAGGDVSYPQEGYASLKITDQQVIDKYDRALKKGMASR